jgi:hypothetical protein
MGAIRKIRISIRKKEKKRLGYVVKQDVRADVNAELIKAQLQRDLSFFFVPFYLHDRTCNPSSSLFPFDFSPLEKY